MPETRLRVLTDWPQVEAMAETWDRLLPERPHRNFFMSFGRLSVWWRHDQNHGRPHVIVFEEAGRPVALLPLALCTQRRSGLTVRTLEILGGSTMEFCAIPLPADRPDLVALSFDHVLGMRGEWDVMWLAELDAPDPVTGLFLREAERRGLAVDSRLSALCPYLPLDRPFEALLADLFDAKSRSTRLRRVRSLLKTPGLEVHRWEPGTDLEPVLGAILSLERDSWKGQQAMGLFAGMSDWHCHLIRETARRGLCDLRWVTLEGRVVAYRVGFVWENVYCDYNTAYHPDVAKLSPSTVLLHQTIEDLAGWGVKRIEFCRGVQRYKLEWATGLRESRLVRIYNRTMRAKLLRGLAAAKTMFKGRQGDERPELPIPLKDPLPPYESSPPSLQGRGPGG